MALIRWDPFSELEPFREDFSRLFDRYSNLFGMRSWQPALDLVENNNDFVLKVEVPGMEPEDVDITVTDNSVVISGSMSQEEEKKNEGGYLRSERRYGKFMRNIALPAEIVPDKTKATFKNGLLTITLPKADPGRTNGVKIKIDHLQ
ncbi:MAG: Hsp20/alpha crystallin family protein [bacterium]|jgi:HSP20 family protein